MGDLSTYSLGDFFPFLPEVYFRLFVRLNQNWWPLHVLAAVAGVAALGLMWRGRGRWVSVIQAACWAFVGYAYFFDMYANLNWAGTYIGWAFMAQGALLLVYGLTGRLDAEREAGLAAPSWAGAALAAFALFVHPLLGPLTGREWSGVEIFGLAPEPTALATLGLVLMAGRVRWLLCVIPVLWCAYAGATTWVMEAPVGLVTPALAVAALGIGVWKWSVER